MLDELDLDVLISPDHAPTIFRENNDEPEYAALGRIRKKSAPACG